MNWAKSDFAHRMDRATRGAFWKGIAKCLDELHIAGRKKVEAAIAKNVPRLTKRELAMWRRRCQELGLPVPRYHDVGKVIETHEHTGEFKEW
jgi:hypothetical protein